MKFWLTWIAALGVAATAWAGATPMQFDTFPSTIVLVTHRSGLLSFLGHEHAIWAAKWQGTLVYNPQNVRASSVEIAVPVATLVVDADEARRRAELESKGPSEEDQEKIRTRMLGPEVLDAAKFPEIRFRSQQVDQPDAADRTRISVRGQFSLHGVTQTISVPIRISTGENGTLRLRGSYSFKLSDYGIAPPSTSGVVNVKDEVELKLDVRTRAETVVAER